MKIRKIVIRTSYTTQCLIKEWLIGNFVLWRKIIDEEKIPLHIVICKACFGDTGSIPWVSKFAPFNSKGELL